MKRQRVVRTLLVVLAAFACASTVLSGQSTIPGPTPSVLTSTDIRPVQAVLLEERADSVERDIRPTHWKEGALVGGLIGLVGGALLGAALCENSEEANKNCSGSTVGGGLIFGLVLAIPGALIGGQIPKGSAAE